MEGSKVHINMYVFLFEGTEFKAIFISTSEPTHEDGRCKYETKSISDRYVFNTAITRSKSLIVAVGNPLFLIHLENQMIEKYGESARCWSHYIRQCIECKTFSFSKKLRNSSVKPNIDKLLNTIYATSPISAELVEPDSIINAYKRVFEELKECRKTKLMLSSSSGGKLSWKMEDYAEKGQETVNDEVSLPIKDKYECILHIHHSRKAKAIPLDSSKQIVKIRGSKNRKGAFHEDTIIVGVFEVSPKGKSYGQVLKVVKRGSNLKFICTVCNTNPIVFFPIDEKNPHLINLPRLSKDLLQKKDIRNDTNEVDLATKNVVVFKMPPKVQNEEVEDVPLPQIKQIIPLSVAKNMLFLVSFVKWDLKYRSPLGIVEGVFPKGFSHFNAERLLTFQHGVVYNEVIEKNNESQVVDFDASPLLNSPVFTIDPEGAQNLDDAFSIAKQETEVDGKITYKLGVHIVNAAKHVHYNQAADVEARHIGLSTYSGKKGKVMHMLSSEELRSQISLTPGKVRSVISVSCSVTLDPCDHSSISIKSVTITDDQVKSCMKLTYKIAQTILHGHIPPKYSSVSRLFKDFSLCRSMKALYDISFAMRLKRMQSDAAYAYDISEADEEDCWQTHLLVEELMIWANSEVAKKLYDCYPDAAILRCQSPPNKAELDKLVEENKSAMANSLSLSRFINSDELSNFSAVLVPVDVLHKIKQALQENDLVKLFYYLFTNKCYPQLAAIESEIHSISLSAEYCCTEKSKDSFEYRHSGLCLNKYTHFSSPMRRYCDLQVQRILLKCLKASSADGYCSGNCEISHAENNKICLELNTSTKNSKRFEKKIKLVNETLEFLTTSKVYSAYIIKDTGKTVILELPHLNLKSFPRKSLIINISNISLSYSMVSLKLTNMAEVLQAQHFIITSTSSNSNGEINAFITETNSQLYCAKYKFTVDDLGIKIQNKPWMEAMNVIKKTSLSLDSNDKAKLVDIFSAPSKALPIPDLKDPDKKWLYVNCKVYDPWKSPGIVKVWLSWSMKSYIISPIIQLIEISPLIRFCNQHCSHPAVCFSDPNLTPASKRTYKNVNEYITLWKKVLLAEAAEKSVHERDGKPVVFRDVHLIWPKLEVSKECVNELYYVPSGKVQMILPRNFSNECLTFFDVKVGSLVCVRCEDETESGVKAVFHFVVHKVDVKVDADDHNKIVNDVVVEMTHIGDQNCRISCDMKAMLDSRQWKYEVQIIYMSYSYR